MSEKNTIESILARCENVWRIFVMPTPCWEWTGHKLIDYGACNGGYGMCRFNGRNRLVHKVMYERFIGQVPEGKELDHICRNRACCNPYHLDAVPHRINVLRGISPFAEKALQTHCINGHAFTTENTFLHPNGGRQCRQCHRDCFNRRYREKMNALGKVLRNERTHFKCGHLLVDENIIKRSNGYKVCRACNRAYASRYYLRNKKT